MLINTLGWKPGKFEAASVFVSSYETYCCLYTFPFSVICDVKMECLPIHHSGFAVMRYFNSQLLKSLHNLKQLEAVDENKIKQYLMFLYLFTTFLN